MACLLPYKNARMRSVQSRRPGSGRGLRRGRVGRALGRAGVRGHFGDRLPERRLHALAHLGCNHAGGPSCERAPFGGGARAGANCT